MTRKTQDTKPLLVYVDDDDATYFRYFNGISFGQKWRAPFVKIGSRYNSVALGARQVRTVIAKLQGWLAEMEES